MCGGLKTFFSFNLCMREGGRNLAKINEELHHRTQAGVCLCRVSGDASGDVGLVLRALLLRQVVLTPWLWSLSHHLFLFLPSVFSFIVSENFKTKLVFAILVTLLLLLYKLLWFCHSAGLNSVPSSLFFSFPGTMGRKKCMCGFPESFWGCRHEIPFYKEKKSGQRGCRYVFFLFPSYCLQLLKDLQCQEGIRICKAKPLQ